jgi:uncharacterized surface protein with fasciclin (FAS1) repeats
VKGFNRSQPLEAITADGTHYMQFYIAPGNAVVLQDVQNNTANVLGNGTEVGNTMLYSIDKVLLSGKTAELVWNPAVGTRRCLVAWCRTSQENKVVL